MKIIEEFATAVLHVVIVGMPMAAGVSMLFWAIAEVYGFDPISTAATAFLSTLAGTALALVFKVGADHG